MFTFCAGEPPKGLRKANLTERTLPFLEEVALNEQVNAGRAVTCNDEEGAAGE